MESIRGLPLRKQSDILPKLDENEDYELSAEIQETLEATIVVAKVGEAISESVAVLAPLAPLKAICSVLTATGERIKVHVFARFFGAVTIKQKCRPYKRPRQNGEPSEKDSITILKRLKRTSKCWRICRATQCRSTMKLSIVHYEPILGESVSIISTLFHSL
jgi:hypothetical protein